MQQVKTANSIPQFLSGGGEMGERIRNYDWASTPIGPIETWPQSLRTCIRIMLTSRQPIWIGWGKSLIKFYNDPYISIVRGKHPRALGQPASEVWKDIWKDIEPLLKQVMEENEGNYSEAQLLLMERNGYPEETYYTFSYTPIPGDSGKTEGMFCANTEDTDRIISERQLKTLTQLGKSLTDCRTSHDTIKRTIATLQNNPYDFPFALFRVIRDNKAILANSTPLGSSSKIVSPELDLTSTTPVIQTINRAIATGENQVFEGVRSKIGQLPVGAWDLSPDKILVIPILQTGFKDPSGLLIMGLNPYRLYDEKYSSFLGLVADQVATSFADVHVFEEERKRSEALAEIDRAKTTFFSNISHEFRTPLTLMAGPIEDLLNDPSTIPANRARMEIAHRNVFRLLKLVNTLLDFSRIEAGRMRASFELVNISQVTKDLASTFRSAIEKAGMQLVVEADDRLEAYVDIDMWEKIVLNILSNAFKYTHDGTIAVRVQKKNKNIVLSVTDTGVGIPKKELTKVFERFHRIQNTAGRSQEGTGIGLSLVQELVKLHHGKIDVTSTEGEGTTFSITISEGSEHLPPDQILESPGHTTLPSRSDVYVEEALKWLPSESKKNGATFPVESIDETAPKKVGEKKQKVLLADDNADMRQYVSRLLEQLYEVTAVPNGRLALDAAKRMQPDLIISDVMMPEMDGFELVRHLKANTATHHIPVILLSARAGEEATIEGLQAGADDYLVKPFSARELASRVDSNIKIAQSRNRAFQQLYNLFMAAPVAIAILRGKEQRFELANSSYLEIAGKSDIVGKTIYEAFPELSDKGIPELLDKVFTTGEQFVGNEYEVELVRSDRKEKVYLNFVYSPFQETAGVISGVMVIAVDVTAMVLARKAIEENEDLLELEVAQRTLELKKANDELQRSNNELEQYAFVTSHDLQEPLRKIQTFANMMYERNEEKFDEKSVSHFNKVMHAAKRMSGMIADLLQYSRLTRSESYVEVDLNELFMQVESDFELAIQQKGAKIVAGNLPVVEAVPLQMNQLFGNLIGNALKFSSTERSPEIRIESHRLTDEERAAHGLAEKPGGYAEIVVKDNGIGFDPSYAEKIFEIFQRLYGRDVYEGTGIGLALCSRIATSHHGKIFAEGFEGRGSNFHVILPLKQ